VKKDKRKLLKEKKIVDKKSNRDREEEKNRR